MAELNYVGIIIFATVYLLIILRNLRTLRIPVWTVMLGGAVAMIFLNALPLNVAYRSVNLDVILFLFGMFTIVAAMDISGLLEYMTLRIIEVTGTPARAFALIILGFALMSAFLMNDTLALMATPIILSLARQMRMRPSVLLIGLAMGITIGSVFTPVGNPQNLLIAVSSGLPNPFFSFLYYLLPPTLLCLGTTYLILRTLYRKDLAKATLSKIETPPRSMLRDARLAKISGYTILLVILGFLIVGTIRLFGIQSNANLGTVALLGGTLIYIVSSRRREIIGSIDWGIIIFFISLFIVTEGLWQSNILQVLMTYFPALSRTNQGLTLGEVIGSSIVLSQLISNVPFVAVYIRVLQAAGFSGTDVKIWMALAGASTLAGALSLFGAASNVIILEEAERRGEGFSFLEFLKAGMLVTIPNVLILWFFLMVV